MARKSREAPWDAVHVTFKLRKPRSVNDIKKLKLPDKWELVGLVGRTERLRTPEDANYYTASGALCGKEVQFRVRGDRPNYDDGEIVLAKLNMLKEYDLGF